MINDYERVASHRLSTPRMSLFNHFGDGNEKIMELHDGRNVFLIIVKDNLQVISGLLEVRLKDTSNIDDISLQAL